MQVQVNAWLQTLTPWSRYNNDQSALLWTEGSRTFFWGGGAHSDPKMPFKVAVSEDSGGTWLMHLPNITNTVPTSAKNSFSLYHTNKQNLRERAQENVKELN